jgi:hypothetical protein
VRSCDLGSKARARFTEHVLGLRVDRRAPFEAVKSVQGTTPLSSGSSATLRKLIETVGALCEKRAAVRSFTEAPNIRWVGLSFTG